MRKNKTLDLAVAYEKVFASPEGKKVLWDLMKVSGFLSSSFQPTKPHTVEFNEGQRNMFLYVLTKVNTTPDKLFQIMKEGEDYDATFH